MRSTYFDREDARFIVNIHPIFDAVNVRVHFTWERTPSERVAFGGEGSGVVEFGVGHVVGSSVANKSFSTWRVSRILWGLTGQVHRLLLEWKCILD